MDEALAASLARIIEVANAHAARGVERGDPIFALLWARVLQIINKHDETEADILKQAPALKDLRSLTGK